MFLPSFIDSPLPFLIYNFYHCVDKMTKMYLINSQEPEKQNYMFCSNVQIRNKFSVSAVSKYFIYWFHIMNQKRKSYKYPKFPKVSPIQYVGWPHYLSQDRIAQWYFTNKAFLSLNWCKNCLLENFPKAFQSRKLPFFAEETRKIVLCTSELNYLLLVIWLQRKVQIFAHNAASWNLKWKGYFKKFVHRTLSIGEIKRNSLLFRDLYKINNIYK